MYAKNEIVQCFNACLGKKFLSCMWSYHEEDDCQHVFYSCKFSHGFHLC